MLYVPAWLLLSLMIAASYGALFHLAWGRTVIGLLRALLIAAVGFLAGETGARLADMHTLMVGDIHMGIASLGAWLGLAVNYWRTIHS